MKDLTRRAMAGLTLLAGLGLTISAAAQQNGAGLYLSSGCAACHGVDGNEPALSGYPKLGGQDPEYLLNQMTDIKNGTRNNGQSAAMQPSLANLSEADMAAIAQWLSQQISVPPGAPGELQGQRP